MLEEAKSTRRGGRGFTIIELLTVMSIIIILISVLVPALNKTRIFAKKVTQKGQFHEISKGLELFRNDHQDTYPDSGAVDSNGLGYCGAMRLCEALLGQDGMGYHPLSNFHSQQPDTYLFDLCIQTDPSLLSGSTADPKLVANLQERIKYMDVENVRSYRLQNIYNWDISAGVNFYPTTGAFNNTYPNAVIGDVFQRATLLGAATPMGCPQRAGQKAGMPVLYYKADPSKLSHDAVTQPATTTPNTNIYNFDDNYAITALGCPWEGSRSSEHPMYLPANPGPLLFLREITNTKVTSTPRPHNEDGYILMSAGWDGLYGTKDDVFNFAD